MACSNKRSKQGRLWETLSQIAHRIPGKTKEEDEVTSYLLSLPKAMVDLHCPANGIQGLTLVGAAARMGNLRVLRHLVLENNADICPLDAEGRFPIYHAVYFNEVETTRFFLERFFLEQYRCQGHSILEIRRCPGDARARGTLLLKMAIENQRLNLVKTLMEGAGEGSTCTGLHVKEEAWVYYLPVCSNSLDFSEYFCAQHPVPKAVMGTCLMKALRMAKNCNMELRAKPY